jgi:hypothetical protein
LPVLGSVAQADYTEVNVRPPIRDSSDHATSGASETAKPGLQLTPSSVDLVEGGDPASYRAVLRKRPSAPVVISVVPDDQTLVNPTVLVFDAADWNVPQDVAVTARDDSVFEGPHLGTVSHYIASTDSEYQGLEPVELTARIEDNDAAAITINPSSLTVSEPNGSASLRLRLASPPSAIVVVPLAPSSDQCAISPQSVTLDQENWESGSEATVSAEDDAVLDGEQICLIEGGPSVSDDPTYNGLIPNVVTVTVLDDEGSWRILLPQAYWHWPPLPAPPALRAIENVDGDGAYTVAWGAAARAETYVLEEATDPTFTAAQVRYAGPATSFDVQGEGAARLFYRVKAQNDWGDSRWSGAEAVDVLWEAEPNDDAHSQANGPLASGIVYRGAFLSGQDTKDYYFFDLSAPSAVELWLTNIPEGHNYDLVLRDADLEPPRGYSGGTGNQDEYLETSLPMGRYYVQVYNTSSLGSTQSYRLQIQY